jgi:hypothetical protein
LATAWLNAGSVTAASDLSMMAFITTLMLAPKRMTTL